MISYNSINAKSVIKQIKFLEIDLLFNQSQHILKKEVLDSVRLDVFNRHGGLLPLYRGRLSPFWQLLNKEKYGGLTYHVVDDKIDNGPIIYQKQIPIEKNETVPTLISKIFDNAIEHFQTVLDFYNDENYKENYIKNDSIKKSYFSYPTIIDALRFRLNL